MHPIARYLMESHIRKPFIHAVYEAVCSLFEATNINKAFLIQQAGGEEQFKAARAKVMEQWENLTMSQFIPNQNQSQKLINFLILMEIRQSGFVNQERMNAIHDLATEHSLDQRFLSKVNSDTTPAEADQKLTVSHTAAANAGKVYPTLTPEEERVWNRVKVYHEFEDGFKWVYAVDDNGHIIGYMPTAITTKTMRHCGNEPAKDIEGNQYWELRGPDGRAYLTVILNKDDCIEESKSFGNRQNMYRQQIKPYVKWFLRDQKVKGVGKRYNYGYATNMNFGVKDFMDDDQEYVEEVLMNKPALIGNTERLILMWRDLLKEGVVSETELKSWFSMKNGRVTTTDLPDRVVNAIKNNRFCVFSDECFDHSKPYEGKLLFGDNRFEVICGIFGGVPFTEMEMSGLISHEIVTIEQFANHDVKLLTPEVQAAFVGPTRDGYTLAHNLNVMIELSTQVAQFKVCNGILNMLSESEDPSLRILLYKYLAYARPAEKVKDCLHFMSPDDGRVIGSQTARIGMGFHSEVVGFSSLVMRIQSRFPGSIQKSSEYVAANISACVGDTINERGKEMYTEMGQVYEFLSTLADCSQEIIDEYSRHFPDGIAIRMLMMGDRPSIPNALGILAGKNPKWAIPDSYIENTLQKLNARISNTYSRQSQSMLVKMLNFIAGLPDKEKAYRFANVISGGVYYTIWETGETGLAINARSSMMRMITSIPQIFNDEFFRAAAVISNRPITLNYGPGDGMNMIAYLMVTDDNFSADILREHCLDNDRMRKYLDIIRETGDMSRFVGECYRCIDWCNLPADQYRDELTRIFINGQTYDWTMRRMIEMGIVSMPRENWDNFIETAGMDYACSMYFSNLSPKDISENGVAEYVIKNIVEKGGDNAGELWSKVFNRHSRETMPFLAKMKELTVSILNNWDGRIPSVAVQSLVKAGLIKSADARRLLHLTDQISDSSTIGMLDIWETLSNIDKIESKKRPPFLIAALKKSQEYRTEHMDDMQAYRNIVSILNILNDNAGVQNLDPVVKYVLDNEEAIRRIALDDNEVSANVLNACINNIRATNKVVQLEMEPDDASLDKVCRMLTRLYARANWKEYIQFIDKCVQHRIAELRNDGVNAPNMYCDYTINSVLYGLNKLGVRKGRAAILRQLLPEIAHQIDTGNYNQWRYTRVGNLFAVEGQG